MCPIQSTDGDDEQLSYGLLFLVRYTEDGVTMDSSLDVSSCLGTSWIAISAAEKLTGTTNEEARRLSSALFAMRLRTRIDGNCYGPYLVKHSAPLTASMVEQILRDMPSERRKAFLEMSRM